MLRNHNPGEEPRKNLTLSKESCQKQGSPMRGSCVSEICKNPVDDCDDMRLAGNLILREVSSMGRATGEGQLEFDSPSKWSRKSAPVSQGSSPCFPIMQEWRKGLGVSWLW